MRYMRSKKLAWMMGFVMSGRPFSGRHEDKLVIYMYWEYGIVVWIL